MLKLIAFGIAVGAGIQGWRNFPPDGPISGSAVLVLYCVGVLCAFLGGLNRRRHSASAWASAHAEASASASSTSTATANQTQTLNVALLLPGGASNGAGRVPVESAPWVLDSASRSASLDDFEGMDVAELLEEREQA